MNVKNLALSLTLLLTSAISHAQPPVTMQKTPPTPRIVGGDVVREGAWQSYAILSDKSNPDNAFCGATLIAPNWAMSAAHCFSNRNVADTRIAIGLYEYSGANGRNAKEYFDIKRVVRHPNFVDGMISTGDLALIELDGRSSEKVATLYAGKATLSGNAMTVVGFGDTVVQPPEISNPSKYPAYRYQVSLLVIDNALCRAAMTGITNVEASQLCIGIPEGKKDSCIGDSGGPLYLNRAAGNEVVAGIVSFGVGCALPSYYSVNTRVSDYIDYIRQYVPNVKVDTTDYGTTLSREASGAWFNPDRNGEGWIIEMLPNNRMTAYWFTYDLTGGKPIFLVGAGDYNPNADRATLTLYQTSGATFGDAFRASDVTRTTWGTLTFTLTSCSQADIEYASSLAGFGSGKHTITRLTAVNTTNCAGRFDGSERRLAGSWFDPSRSGEGLILETLQGNRLGYYFFTYDFTGHQQTFFGVAERQADGTFLGKTYRPYGPRFGDHYDKGDLKTDEKGQVIIRLLDCNQIDFTYTLSGAYGQHTHRYQRLTHVEGNECY